MGPLILPSGGPIYVDANAIIYSVERVEPYCSLPAPTWEAASTGRFILASSELVALEVLVKPLRDGNVRLEMLFRSILAAAEMDLIPATSGNVGRSRPYPRRDGLGDLRRPPRCNSSSGRLPALHHQRHGLSSSPGIVRCGPRRLPQR